MANKQISELTAAGALDGTELVHVVKGGNSRQTTAAAVAGQAFPSLTGNEGYRLVVSSGETTVEWEEVPTLESQLPTLTGNEGNVLAVASGETTVEWIAVATYPSFTGNAGKVLATNSGEDGVEWVENTQVPTVTDVSASRDLTDADLDGNTILRCTNSSPINLTVVSSLTATGPLVIMQTDAAVTLVQGASTTVTGLDGLVTDGVGAVAALIPVGSDAYFATGKLTT